MTTVLSIITAIHLAALSQIESGDNDHAIGKAGEVSRYQIMPELWSDRCCCLAVVPDPCDQIAARIVACDIWESRAEKFQKKYHRLPTTQEIYLLWNRPAHIGNPTEKERERAQRFENLVIEFRKGSQ